MLEFFFSLPKRLKEVEIVDTCEYELPEGSVLIGEASDTIQQLVSLHCSVNQRITFLSESLETSCMKSERADLNVVLEKTRTQYAILQGMIEGALVEAYPQAYMDGKHVAYIGPNWGIFKISSHSLQAEQSDGTTSHKSDTAPTAMH